MFYRGCKFCYISREYKLINGQILIIPCELISAVTRYVMFITAQNTEISPNFLVWKFCGKVQSPQSFGRFPRNFPQNFHTRKLVEVSVCYVVYVWYGDSKKKKKAKFPNMC